MDREQYARISEALRVTESTMRAPLPDAPTSDWQQADGHFRIAASMHRTLGNFGGALRLLRWFANQATVAAQGNPELHSIADHAATTVWEWETEVAARQDKLVALRHDLLDAEVRQAPHDVRAVRMAIADHEEASGNFGEASAQLHEVALRMPVDEPSLPALRERIYDLDARCDQQRFLVLAPDQRPVLDREQFLAPNRSLDPALQRVPTLN